MEREYVVALDRSGNVGVNASVRVTEYPGGALATLYADDGVTPKGNPFLTDQNGSGFFYAANGRYTIEITGGGLLGTVRTDVTLFDPADGAFESTQVAGLGDLSGQAQFDVLVSDGANFLATPLEGSVFDARYAKVNDTTEGYIHAEANRAGTTAPLEADNLGAGYLAVFRQAGVDKAWITNDGGAEFSGDVVIHGGLTITGDPVTVIGNEVNIGDSIILLNSDETGTPVANSGVETERGPEPNSFIGWMEAPDRYQWTPDLVTYYTVPGLEHAETVSGDWDFTGTLTAGGSTVWHNGNVGAQLDALTVDAAPDGAADYVMTYDASEGAVKKVLLDNLPGGGSGGDADTLDGVDSTQFLRSDVDDTASGMLSIASRGITILNETNGDGTADIWFEQRISGFSQGGLSFLDASGNARTRLICDSASAIQVGANGVAGAAVKLLCSGTTKLQTADTGVSVTGDITATGNVSWNASDRWLKTPFNDFDSGALVDAVTVGSFRYDPAKCEAAGFKNYDDREHYGFDARNLYEVGGERLSALAPFDNDGEGKSKSGNNYRTPRDRELLAVLYREVKALRARVKELENG